MIEIDGSMGEGGGSVLRFSLAFASVIQEPIEVYNIRANRSKPGLANQHLNAVKALKELTDAEVEGLEMRSEKVIFQPKTLKGGDIKIDIGSAGSTTLILQAVMIPAAFAKKPLKIEITGGTNNPYAPPIEFLKHVTLPILKKIGYKGEVKLIKRGHYPKGGGKIKAKIRPIKKFQTLHLTNLGQVKTVSGISHCVKLPGHIAKRQAESAEKEINKAGYEGELEVESYKKSEDPHLSPGTGVVLWAETNTGAILGSSSLGEKGKPAEKVGKEAAESLIKQLETGNAVDKYLTDQIIPYLALASDESEITSTELTSHALTNAKLVRKILGTEVKVEGEKGNPGKIMVKGFTPEV